MCGISDSSLAEIAHSRATQTRAAEPALSSSGARPRGVPGRRVTSYEGPGLGMKPDYACAVARPTIHRRLSPLLVVLVVLSHGGLALAVTTQPERRCAMGGHPCGGATFTSCCCTAPVGQPPMAAQDGRVEVRPHVQLVALAAPALVPMILPALRPARGGLRAGPSIPLVILFSTYLI